MTHGELVLSGEKWLRNSVGCSVVAAELTCLSWQQPDVIGFKSSDSYLIEVKVSRSDFHADKKKNHQLTPEKSVGNYRWYLAPSGLLTIDDLPKGWGLLEPNGAKMRTVRGTLYRAMSRWDQKTRSLVTKEPKAGYAHRFKDINDYGERAMLFSIARRQAEQLATVPN